MKKIVTAIALMGFSALCLTGCTNEDDFGRLPEGSIPLELGNVAIAGVQTVETRTAIAEDAQGYTGIRKSRFVAGDKLLIRIDTNGDGTGGDATLNNNGVWELNHNLYITPGVTTIKATHTPAAPASGMTYADNLITKTYTLAGQKLVIDLKHANALIDVTCPAGVSPTNVEMTANNGQADEILNTAIEEEADGTLHYRTIAAPGTLKDISAEINGINYTATFATPLTVEANKRYPVTLTFKDKELTATVGTADLDWGAGGDTGILPNGYTRLIGTPEDLAQFAADVNDDAEGTGARAATVLQMANIDMAQLMTAEQANAARPGRNYTYTATPDNWVPIAADAVSMGRGLGRVPAFTGKYNGNGYTISNLEGNALFARLDGAALTGIHLRNVKIPGDNRAVVGALANSIQNWTVVSLCSATGSLSGEAIVGGLLGRSDDGYITRCSADVELTNSADVNTVLGGLIGVCETSTVAGCMAKGNITGTGTSNAGGLIGAGSEYSLLGCSATGDVTATGNCGALLGEGDAATTVVSCYATGTCTAGFGPAEPTYTDCAYTGSDTPAGVSSDVALSGLYTVLTANAAPPTSIKILHWSKADGYTLNEVTANWQASHVWNSNGASAPAIDMKYEGSPEPVVAGGKVYKVNGYFVSAPDADETKTYAWASPNADNDSCAGHGDWHLPSMTDFEKIGGWSESNPWLGSSLGSTTEGVTDTDQWNAAFPNAPYWSTNEDASDTSFGYGMGAGYSGAGKGGYNTNKKMTTCRVRCVQVQYKE